MGSSSSASRAPGEDSPLQVIIVHRHGHRFPTKMVGWSDPSWPQRQQFWDDYAGQLTPIGGRQLNYIGKSFQNAYYNKLFDNATKVDGNMVRAFTSNKQRTLHSALAFLGGFLGSTSSTFESGICFGFRTDRGLDESWRNQMMVPIFVEDGKPDDHDMMFHQWKMRELRDKYKKWKKKNLRNSIKMQHWATDPKVVELVKKLHAVTGNDKLDKGDMFDRMEATKNIHTTMIIQKVQGQPVFPNKGTIEITEDEKQTLGEIADELKKCWFQGTTSSARAESFGQWAASCLVHHVFANISSRAAGKSNIRFLEFSAHDTTVAAFANCLGIELPGVGFGCYFVFELHRKAGGDGFEVRAFYNEDPTNGISLKSLASKVLPSGPSESTDVIRWENLPEGGTDLIELERNYLIPYLVRYQELMHVISEDMDANLKRMEEILKDPSFTDEKLASLVSDDELSVLLSYLDLSGDQAIDMKEWAAKLALLGFTNEEPELANGLLRLFDVFDTNKDKILSKVEVRKMLGVLQVLKDSGDVFLPEKSNIFHGSSSDLGSKANFSRASS